MIKITQNLQQALHQFSSFKLDISKAIISQIFVNTINNLPIFSKQEKEEMAASLGVSVKDFTNVVNAFVFLIKICTAERNYAEIEKQVLATGIDPAHFKIFSENWQQYSSEFTNMMRDQLVSVNGQLTDFDWAITLPVESSHLPVKNCVNLKENQDKININDDLYSIDEKNPKIVINFSMKKDANANEDFAVKMTKGQFQTLFENIEKLQEQLDLLV